MVIVSLAPSHAQAAAQLITAHLSPCSPLEILKWIDQGRHCLAAVDGDTVSAVAVAAIDRQGHTVGLPGPAGVMQYCVVEPLKRGRGIGTALTERRHTWICDQDVQVAYSTAWRMPDGQVPARAQLQACGYVHERDIPQFWAGDPCGVCGDSCRCPAALHVWRRDRSAPSSARASTR